MDYKPAAKQDRIMPYLAYRDAPAAIDFLTRAFGFVERYRFHMDDGRVEDHGRRSDRALDPEGHHWIFSTVHAT